jgi:protocatechuate 3,4-dioxygenase beta subunit
MKRVAIGAAAALVAAFLVYWFGFRSRGEETAEKAAPKAAAPVRASTERSGGGPAPEMRVLQDDDPAGTLTLEGQVLGEGEQPVGGAVVAIDSNPPRSAKSEADGSFSFDKLLPRAYTVVARAPAGVAGPVTARLSAKSDPIILRLKPASAVDVTVVSVADGKTLSGARVELRGIDTLSGTTGADWVAHIASVVPGGYMVAGQASGFATGYSWTQVAGGGATAQVRLELRRGAPVSGKVIDPDGKPVKGARVSFGGASAWSQQADPRRDGATSGDDGSFKFAALPAGTFRFEAQKDGFAPGHSELVTLDGQSEKSGVEVRMARPAALRGQVVAKDGTPVAGARVRAVVSTTSMLWGDARQAFSDDAGTFALPDLPRAVLEVVAIGESGSSAIEKVDVTVAPFDRRLTLTLDVDGAIAGVVVDRAGEPIEGAEVTAWPDLRSNSMASMRVRGFPEEMTDAGGRFAIRGLEEGEYDVRAVPPGAASGPGGAFLRDPIKAKTGTSNLRIVLPADGGIRGKVAFKDGSAPGLFTVGFGWGGGRPFSDPKGAFELGDLAPKSYSITVRGPGFDSRTIADVVVEEGKTVDLGTITVSKGRTVSGRVVAAGGQPVQGATVRCGRILFGDGSSSKASFGGGPPGARNAKDTTTDENGEFTLYGVGRGDLSIVAEHETLGRSSSMRLPGQQQSVTGLSLVLAPYGSLEGKVTKAGAPLGQVIVTAASLTVPTAMFSVASGEDGTFRFDRLAPDKYKVSAMTGSPMRGMGFHSTSVAVESGKTAHVDLAIDAGTIKLVASVVEKSGKPLGFALLMGVEGKITAKVARDLWSQIGGIGQGYSHQGFSVRGMPVELPELKPSIYTLCAVPYPVEVKEFGQIMEYGEREGDTLPVTCKQVNVTAEPAEQKVSIEVTAPAYVPPPPEDS